MTLRIPYVCDSFPSSYSLSNFGTLNTSWDDLLWAAITIGRPDVYHVLRHGTASLHEAIFRLSLIKMAVEENWFKELRRTGAFQALDPTEKGMVSYFLGMTLCKLFAANLLHTHWLLHLDVFRSTLNPVLIGRSRPDLIGENNAGNWYAFESKGRSSPPSQNDKAKAKQQARRVVSINGNNCTLHIGSFAFFNNDVLEFYWRDPEPDLKSPIELPRPEGEWRFYFEPALSLATTLAETAMMTEFKLADVTVEIHPSIKNLLEEGLWQKAYATAKELRDELRELGYKPDGIRVTAGESWSRARSQYL